MNRSAQSAYAQACPTPMDFLKISRLNRLQFFLLNWEF